MFLLLFLASTVVNPYSQNAIEQIRKLGTISEYQNSNPPPSHTYLILPMSEVHRSYQNLFKEVMVAMEMEVLETAQRVGNI